MHSVYTANGSALHARTGKSTPTEKTGDTI
jgi:hypothetical protein